MNRRCDHCACENPPEAAFCRQCGRPTAEPILRSTTRLGSLLAQWRKLSLKLTRNEIRKLLGEPKRIECASLSEGGATAAHETWTYEYESVAGGARVVGVVKISPAESRVLAWSEPDWDQIRQ